MSVEAGLSNNTLLGYGRDLEDFARFCLSKSAKSITEVRPKHVYDYLHYLSKKSFVETTINRHLVAIKMLIRFCLLTGVLREDFTAVLEGPKQWKKLPRICSRDKVIELLNTPDPQEPYYLRDRALLEILYATGCRASEAAGLNVKDLNLAVGYVRCFGKGNKERIVPLGKTAARVIEQYIAELRPKLAKPHSKDGLFLSRTGRKLDRVDIWRIFKKYARLAGLGKNVTVHTIRHCFATHLLSGGADLRSVQEMLGHVDFATTHIYTHVDNDRLKKIHKQFHPRG
jgi:integrase/recombinase XerD